MKRALAILVGATLMSASAYASKARMQALGQDRSMGSHYLMDKRNIFHNPAHLNNTGNFVNMEWGSAMIGSDAQTTPQGEGGFAMSSGDMVYGFWLGGESNTAKSFRNDGTIFFMVPDNQWEIMVAGNAGMNWGASLYMTSNKRQVGATPDDANESSMGLRLGAAADAWEGWGVLSLSSAAKGAFTDAALTTQGDKDDEMKGKTGYIIGGSYDVGAGKVHVEMGSFGADITDASASATTTRTTSTMKLGFSREHEINEDSMWFYAVDYSSTTSKTETSAASTETKSTGLPVTIGMEAKANSWLTLRGSVKQRVFMNEVDTGTTKSVNSDDLVAAAGASLNYDNFQIDGMFSTGGSTGVLDANTTLNSVSMTYSF